MSVGVSLEELLAWNDEAASHWNDHLDINPALLEVPCDIGGTGNVQGFVRHIWLVELRWGQRLAGLPVIDREDAPSGPLDALFNLHRASHGGVPQPACRARSELGATYTLEIDWIPADLRTPTRRKVAAHALFHSQRHYAQLATLARQAGFAARLRRRPLVQSCADARLAARTLCCFWKQERQSTGRPCVGLKGTVVSAPHSEQVVRVSGRTRCEPRARFALHCLQCLGSF